MNQINEQQSAQQKDAVLQASLDFISTLTGMTPPPIEVAPPEVFAPFKAFADRVCAIFSQPLAPISGLSCACVFQGDECVEQCKLHAAWEETLHDQAEELKHLRAAVAKAGGAAPSPAWCASVDAELADTAEADAGPLGWYAATETAAEEYDLDGEFVRSLFVELLPAWLLAPEETHLLIEIDSLISEDDYGIYGSDFYQCRLCHGESGAGVLNKGIVHEDSCPLADSNYAKAVEKTRQAFASITLPAAAVAEGQERDGESLEPSE